MSAPRLPTTAEAIRLARTLLRTARSGSLAVAEPGSGWPSVSRVGVSTDIDGAPVLLLSRLAAHTTALVDSGRCALLVGDAGKGDPLAHPRLSITCDALEMVDEGDDARVRFRYLAHQPKAALYAGLGDFSFFRLTPLRGSLNAGFGKAYDLTADDIVTRHESDADLAELEPSAIAHMNEDHAEAVSLYAEHFAAAGPGRWTLVGIDVEGIEIASGDDVRRIWFDAPLESAGELRATLVRLAADARAALGRPRI